MPTTGLEWVQPEAAQDGKPSTLRKQLAILRSYLGFCHRTARATAGFSAVVSLAAGWRLFLTPDQAPDGTVQKLFDGPDAHSPKGSA